MDSLAYVVTSGWASGVNVYATVFVTGLVGRVGGVDGVPDVLQRTDVLVLAGALWGVEFVADKIPYVDNAWDAIHTVIRPTIGAIIGALLAGEAQDVNEAFAAVLGGSTALASHAAKAGLRLAVNASPEPVSNIVLSLLEVGVGHSPELERAHAGRQPSPQALAVDQPVGLGIAADDGGQKRVRTHAQP